MDFGGILFTVGIGLIFLFVHFFDDWLLQTLNKKAFEKIGIEYSKGNPAILFFHCLVYISGFIPLFWWLGINFWWLLLLFGSHFLIDSLPLADKVPSGTRTLPDFIRYLLTGKISSLWALMKSIPCLIIDQLLHFSALAIVLLFYFL